MAQTVENRVREIRTKEGATQEELAIAVGVSRQTIVAIERGNYVPSVLLAMSIAKHFEVPVEELFYIV